MSRSANVWDNAALESLFPSIKTERIARKVYRTRDAALAEIFNRIGWFSNTVRLRSKLDHRLSKSG
jgi:putative transposase